jgi:hypothetical protein
MITLATAQNIIKLMVEMKEIFGTEMSTNVKSCFHNISRTILNCDNEINVLHQQETAMLYWFEV